MKINSPILTYTASACLASGASIAKALEVPRADVAASVFVTPEFFEPVTYGFMVLIGLLLIGCTPRPFFFKHWVAAVHSWAFTGFAGVAGGVAGWAITVSVIHGAKSGQIGILQAIAVSSTVLVLTIVPIWMYLQVQPVYKAYSSFRIAQRRGMVVLQIVGILVLIVAGYGFLKWLQQG